MDPKRTVAVMAGAREAQGVIDGLTDRGCRVVASLPEAQRVFGPIKAPTRMGAFACVGDLRAWLAAKNAAAVIDASHAFDTYPSDMARQAARLDGLRYLRVLRAPWRAGPCDRWTTCPSVRAAVEAMPAGTRVFSNTGWQSLPDYAGFSGQIVFLRQTHKATQPPPYRFVTFVEGRPPFSEQDERELFRALQVSHLICRNVGGAASASKLSAARALGLHVLMIDRPPLPPGVSVAANVAEALAWDAAG